MALQALHSWPFLRAICPKETPSPSESTVTSQQNGHAPLGARWAIFNGSLHEYPLPWRLKGGKKSRPLKGKRPTKSRKTLCKNRVKSEAPKTQRRFYELSPSSPRGFSFPAFLPISLTKESCPFVPTQVLLRKGGTILRSALDRRSPLLSSGKRDP